MIWEAGRPQLSLRSHVDDLRLRYTAENDTEAALGAARHANTLLHGLQDMGNKVSEKKTIILGSSASVRLLLKQRMRLWRWELPAEKAARDLRCDSTMALRRSTKQRQARLSKAIARGLHIHMLNTTNNVSKKFVPPGMQAAWGLWHKDE